jgi:hypothetical protein
MGGNGMMMGPAAHSQLMKVLNHLVYVWSGCGNHSMWVWSLDQCTMILFSTQLCSSNLAKISNSGNTDWRQWHGNGPSCPSTAYECSQSPCICLEWMWGPFHVDLQPRSLHLGFIYNPGVLHKLAKISNLGDMHEWQWHGNGPSCPSTA